MKHQLEKKIGQVIVIQTKQGMEVGILEAVTEEGIYLKELPKADRTGIDAEHVFFGFGFRSFGAFGFNPFFRPFGGFGFGSPFGFGFGSPFGFGRFGGFGHGRRGWW